MFRNMVTSLFKHEQIQTTDAKAKELRRWADQLVTLAKRGDLHARRQAMAIIQEKEVVHKLFEEAPKRYADVNGGYTRIIKIGYRPGDAAAVSLVQLVSPEPKKKKKPRRKKKAAPAVETPTASASVEGAASEEEASAAPVETEATPEALQADTVGEPAVEASETTPVEAAEAEAAPADAAPEAGAEDAAPETEDSTKKDEQ
jgi:large subunit ribosomal protein L17